MISIPPNKIWLQNNKSDVFGSLWSSFNLDLTTVEGKARVSPRYMRATLGSGMTDVPVAIEFDGNDHFLMAGPDGTVWKANAVGQSMTGTWNSDQTSSGFPTTLSADYSDTAAFNGYVYFSTSGTNLHKTNNGTSYTSIASTSTSSNKVKMLLPYNYRLYISEAGKIFSIDTSDTPQTTTTSNYAIDLNSNGAVITRMRASSTGIWITTVNTFGGKGHVFFWDGQNPTGAQDYVLEATGAMSLVIKDDVPWIIDTQGRLLALNGASFREIARLPLANRYLYNPISTKNDRWMHPNGMTITDGRIQFLIDNRLNSSGNPLAERCPAGVWEYDETHGLYHKQSLSLYAYSGGAIGDYGQGKIIRAGILKNIKSTATGASEDGSTFAGASYYNGNNITQAGYVWIDNFIDTVQKAGYLVTQKVYSQNIADIWQSTTLRYRKMLSATDKIVLKYRTEEDTPTYFSLSWINSTRFATTTDLSAYVGKEVEIISGSAAGVCAHITAVTGTGTFSVDIDETVTLNTTDYTQPASYARVQNWTKAGYVSDTVQLFDDIPVGKSTSWIQLKAWMLFTGPDEIDDILLLNTKQQ